MNFVINNLVHNQKRFRSTNFLGLATDPKSRGVANFVFVHKSDSVNFNSLALFLLDALSASDETGGAILMDIVPQFPFRPLLLMDWLKPTYDSQVGK